MKINLIELERRNPYPECLFPEKTPKEWKQFHYVLKLNGLSGDGFMGWFGRYVWNNVIEEIKKIEKEEK